MTAPRYDVLGIGNAIVDVIARAEDDFLIKQNMQKGGMALIDEARASAIYDAMGPATESSGGSAANTIAGIASLGGRAAFVGKVRDDVLGTVFAHDIGALGVGFDTPRATDGPSTARCYIMVTPDGERTMNTYLGAAQNLSPSDIDPKLIGDAAITYLEGYLWDPPHAKEAFLKASKAAHDAGRMVALTLSDAFCVGRYRDEFLKLMRDNTVDLRFCQRGRVEEPVRDRRFRLRHCRAEGRRETRRGNAQREGLRGGQQGQDAGGAGGTDRQACRHHWSG